MGKYRDEYGFSLEIIEIHKLKDDQTVILVIQADEDRQTHRSSFQINRENIMIYDELLAKKYWIYSCLPQKSNAIIFIHNGGVVSRFSLNNKEEEVLFEVDESLTKICSSKTGFYLIGLDGYIAHHNGSELLEISLSSGETAYQVVENNNQIYCFTDKRNLYKREENSWIRIDLNINVEIYSMFIEEDGNILLSGQNGLCGKLIDDKFYPFKGNKKHNYSSIAKIKGQIFLGAGYKGLEKVIDDKALTFKDKAVCFDMEITDNYIYTCGGNIVTRHDGSSQALEASVFK